MGSNEGFWDNSFFLAGCVFCHSNLLNFLSWGLEWMFVQMWKCSPHLHISSALFWGDIVWGIPAILGGILYSAFSVLRNIGVEVSFGGIGHDAFVTNKLVEAVMVFGHGVSSLVCGAVAVVAALGCSTLVGLSPLEVKGFSSPLNLLIGGLGISWILLWAILYTVTGIVVGLAVVVVGLTADVWVDVTMVVTVIGVGLTKKVWFAGKGSTITLTSNLLFIGALALFFFSAFLGTVVFGGEGPLSGK